MEEKEIEVSIFEWSSTRTTLSIYEFNFSKVFKHRIDAENWANSVFKKVKFKTEEFS